MGKLQNLIYQNNQLRAKLTAENEAYYGDMLIYLRTSTSIAEEKAEELLVEILEHLVEAQEKGKTAQEVFGTDPEQYCKDLLEHLPKRSMLEKVKNYMFTGVAAMPWIPNRSLLPTPLLA